MEVLSAHLVVATAIGGVILAYCCRRQDNIGDLACVSLLYLSFVVGAAAILAILGWAARTVVIYWGLSR